MIEVLIALVVVGIGLVGLLSLLSSSLKESSTIVEDSFAATLARSVYESVRESAHKRGFLVKDPTRKNYVKGFVLVHDGIKELGQTNPPLTPNSYEGPDVDAKLPALCASDYTIFLPGAPSVTTGPDAGEDVFVYPRPALGGPTTISTAAKDNNGDFTTTPPLPGKSNYLGATNAKPGYAGQQHFFDVNRTYELKSRTPVEVATGSDLYKTPPEVADQYSFAILVRRSVEPVITDNDDGKTPINWANAGLLDSSKFPPRGLTNLSSGVATEGLYQIEVWVYRNFEATTTSRFHDPVRGGRLVGLLALGP